MSSDTLAAILPIKRNSRPFAIARIAHIHNRSTLPLLDELRRAGA
jgi:hypothetical protein